MFTFIFDATEEEYCLWWEGFPAARLGFMKELEAGKWKCCPQWQAHFQLGLQYSVIVAPTKEEAARLWLDGVEALHGRV